AVLIDFVGGRGTGHEETPAGMVVIVTAQRRIVMRLVPVALVLGLLMFAGSAFAGNTPQEEANKKTVLEFYDKALNQKDFEAAAKHFGSRYIQHNPNAADGIEGFRKFIEFRREKFPNARSDIKRALVDGDMVILHVRAVREPGERGVAIV